MLCGLLVLLRIQRVLVVEATCVVGIEQIILLVCGSKVLVVVDLAAEASGFARRALRVRSRQLIEVDVVVHS